MVMKDATYNGFAQINTVIKIWLQNHLHDCMLLVSFQRRHILSTEQVPTQLTVLFEGKWSSLPAIQRANIVFIIPY